MSYNTYEFNYFPFGFKQKYKKVPLLKGTHPINFLKLGESYIAKDREDYRSCYNQLRYIKKNGIEIRGINGVFTRIK